MSNEYRHMIAAEEFRDLVEGKPVTQTFLDGRTFVFALSDIGFTPMEIAIDDARRKGWARKHIVFPNDDP